MGLKVIKQNMLIIKIFLFSIQTALLLLSSYTMNMTGSKGLKGNLVFAYCTSETVRVCDIQQDVPCTFKRGSLQKFKYWTPEEMTVFGHRKCWNSFMYERHHNRMGSEAIRFSVLLYSISSTRDINPLSTGTPRCSALFSSIFTYFTND